MRSEQRPAAAELFARFDAAMSTGDDVGKKRVLDDLTLLVGKEPLKAALEALGVGGAPPPRPSGDLATGIYSSTVEPFRS